MTPAAAWRPMADFDPSRPAIVHDRLNDKMIDWRPDLYLEDYRTNATSFGSGIMAWDGLLLDGWKAVKEPPRRD